MKFQTESELVFLLKGQLKITYPRDSIGIFDEVSLGFGVADLVMCDFREPDPKKIIPEVGLNHSDLNIYNLIRKAGLLMFDELYDTTRSSKGLISSSLRKLMKAGYIKQEDNSFHIVRHYQKPIKNSFAIEAKLSNWKRALHQAYRYKWFAEYSYVVLDNYHSKPAIRNIEMFKKYNVGLATISTNGTIQRFFDPKREKPIDPVMQMMLYEMVKKNYELAR